MAVMVALGLMEENVTEQLKLFWVCIYLLKFIYSEKNTNFFAKSPIYCDTTFFILLKKEGELAKKEWSSHKTSTLT
mgnify:CR=1 FL=1